jgi:hypothetical protein
MNATFNDFITQNPSWKDFDSNADAEIIFLILSRAASVESMIAATADGKPALTPCVMAVENLLEDVPETTMTLGIPRNRQAVGLMVKTILAAYGYEPIPCADGGAKTKPLPDESRARYFSEAAVYRKI